MDITMKNRLNLLNKVLLAVTVPLLYCSGLSNAGGGSIAKTRIPFKGSASGGTLVIRSALIDHVPRFVSINTFPGESAESVVNRMARAIAYSDSIFNFSRRAKQVDRDAIAASMAQGSTLQITGGRYLLAGTETGLGIPKPPLSLSCSYDKQADKFEVKWTNPPGEYGEYDYIKINWLYSNSDKGGGTGFRGTATRSSYTIKRPADVNDPDLDVWLMVFRHDTPVDTLIANGIPLCDNAIPSAVTPIHVTNKGYCQQETYLMPFFAGIAPNWSAWSTAAKTDTAAFEQGDKYDPSLPVYDYMSVRALLTKPFYQVIKAPPEGAVNGVYRKFFGLTPGHTYRLTACINTLEMDSINGDWSLSLCATHNGPDGQDLTTQQLAGLTPLPDGTSGLQAGRIASYSRSNTTKGDFSIVFSSTNAGQQSSHITLPAIADTITVWLRFNCSDPEGKVGFSGVKLEDITANPNPKSTEQIREQEFNEEFLLIKRIERASRH